jgi:apolipoprotein D and lipocalin family protein
MKTSHFLRAPLALSLGLLSAGLCACHAPGGSGPPKAEPLRAMERHVDLPRFMGDWYVIAHIPTFIEKQAYNAVESYQLDPDGSIATTFRFNQGGFDGPLKTYTPRGFIHNRQTNAEWRMRFVWPFKAAYLIVSLADDYQTTIIGVPDRNYVWIMARTPTISPARYAELVEILKNTGHDLSRLRRVPQR